MRPFPSNAGFAIGPILFVIALLGLLAMVVSAGTGTFGTAGTTDRVTADVGSQANLIRTKIEECYMQSLSADPVNVINNSTAPCAGSQTTCPAACSGDPYPCSDQTNGTLVKNLTCPGDPLSGTVQPNLWTGPRSSQLPPPTPGFSEWKYFDGRATANPGVSGGEKCIWTIPSNPSQGIVSGLTRAASKFSSQETNFLDGANTSKKFVIFVTPPINNTLSASSPCAVP
jgi:hypothetical protein